MDFTALNKALQAVVDAGSQLNQDTTAEGNAQAIADSANANLATATATVGQDRTAFNAAIDAAVVALNAAKLPAAAMASMRR